LLIVVKNTAQRFCIAIVQILRIVFWNQVTWDFIPIPMEQQNLLLDIAQVTLL